MAAEDRLRDNGYIAMSLPASSLDLNRPPMPKITRRQFLTHAAGLTAACEMSRRLGWASPAAASDVGWPTAAVAQGSNTDTAADILKTALDGMGGIARFVKPGQTVAIKPNATWAYPPGTASSTDPEVLRALIQMVRDAGAKRIIVMDRSTLWTTAEALQQSGLGKIVDEMGTIADNNPKLVTLFHHAMEIWMKNLPDIPLVLNYHRIPLDTTYWQNWPTATNPYINYANFHRTAPLWINTIKPAH